MNKVKRKKIDKHVSVSETMKKNNYIKWSINTKNCFITSLKKKKNKLFKWTFSIIALQSPHVLTHHFPVKMFSNLYNLITKSKNTKISHGKRGKGLIIIFFFLSSSLFIFIKHTKISGSDKWLRQSKVVVFF